MRYINFMALFYKYELYILYKCFVFIFCLQITFPQYPPIPPIIAGLIPNFCMFIIRVL